MTHPTMFELPTIRPAHPARYTHSLFLTMARMVMGRKRILDPFGGVGGVFELENWLPGVEIDALEIEPEWARQHPKTTIGNALEMPWDDDTFDAIVTSPAYANRMADSLIDGTERITYAAKLGRKLHADNGGGMQWGVAYRAFHVAVWTEARRVLQAHGALVLNIKDHIRKGHRVPVTRWHIDTLHSLGFVKVHEERIETPSMRFGQNGDARVPYESVILFELENKPTVTGKGK